MIQAQIAVAEAEGFDGPVGVVIEFVAEVQGFAGRLDRQFQIPGANFLEAHIGLFQANQHHPVVAAIAIVGVLFNNRIVPIALAKPVSVVARAAIENVIARATVQDVVAAQAMQNIVAAQSVDRIVSGGSVQRVVAIGSVNQHQRVPLSKV